MTLTQTARIEWPSAGKGQFDNYNVHDLAADNIMQQPGSEVSSLHTKTVIAITGHWRKLLSFRYSLNCG